VEGLRFGLHRLSSKARKFFCFWRMIVSNRCRCQPTSTFLIENGSNLHEPHQTEIHYLSATFILSTSHRGGVGMEHSVVMRLLVSLWNLSTNELAFDLLQLACSHLFAESLPEAQLMFWGGSK
jgi:hypothetical protein